MAPDMRNPTSGGRGAREIDQLARAIFSETTTSTVASNKLQRRFGLSAELARILAELAGLGPQAVAR